MDLRIIVSLGLLGILGFLFYPHGAGQYSPTNDVEWVAIKSTLDNEPLREAKLKKDDPVIKTYDLGYIYRIDRAEILFNGMPKDYDILTSKVRNTQEYERAISASATSREHFYPITTFPPKESRWIQVVVNDWYEAQPPQVSSARIGARYEKHNSISSVRTRYNQYDAFLLFDSLKSEPARKWIGARRIEKEVKKDKTTVKEVGYEPLGRDGLDITFDLGGSKRVYGVGVSNGGPENNLKQYKLSLSSDDENYQTVYTSPELENKFFTDSHILDKTYQARYARINIPPGGWYGKYPEIREVEIYTDEYRPSNYNEPIENNNASQVCYDNCGILENKLAPHLIQGFPFDRGEDSDPQIRHSFKLGDEVDPANSPDENSFCYHYDSVIFSYSNLDPGALYWVQVTYLQEKDGKRIQNLVADGFVLHDPMVIPTNTAKKFTYAVPPEAYNDGKMELHFNRIAGPNAVVSEVMLYRASKGNSIPVTYQDGKTGADIYARAPIATTPVVIDGNLDEWSNIYPIVTQGFIDNPSNSPCQMYAQWNTDNLYFAIKIDRAKLKKLSSSPDIINSTDTLHLFIDTAFGSSKNVYKTNNYHFTFSNLGAILVPPSNGRKEATNPDKKTKEGSPISFRRVTEEQNANVIVSQIHHYVDSIPRNIENRKDIETVTRIIPETSEYILEIRIPKGTVLQDYSPQQGGFIGFNYILSNPYIVERDDDPQKTVIKGFEPLFWSAASRDAAPMFWGKLELIGSISGQTAIMDRNMTKKLTSFNAGDIIALTVIDPDRNTDINSSQTITVRVNGNLTNDSKEVTLYETLPLSSHRLGSPSGFTEEQTKGDQLGSTSDIDIQPANDSPFFAGKIKTQFGMDPNDDPVVLTVQGKELVTLEYIDPYYGPNQTNVKVTYTATAKIGTNGSLQILSRSGKEVKQFPAGLRLFFKVQDDDLIRLEGEVQSEPAKVVITITSKTDSEQVTLVDEKNTGTFVGSLETAYNTTANKGDGILQIVGGETIKALYVDTLQASGNTNVSVETSANVDFGNDGNVVIGKSDLVPPSNGRTETIQPEDFVKINSFNAGDILTIIVKDTDLNRDKSAVEQAEAKIEDEQNKDSVTVKLTEISSDSDTFMGTVRTAYGFKPDPNDDLLEVKGKDTVKAIYTDVIQSTGATMVNVNDITIVNVGTDGVISIVKSNYLWKLENFNAGDTVYLKVWDPDLNLSPQVRDQVNISIVSEKTHDDETVTLQEKEPNSGVFYGIIKTEYSQLSFRRVTEEQKPVPADKTLQVQGGERITTLYLDKLRATGESNVPVTDSCIVNFGTTAKLTVFSKADPYTPIAGFPDEGWKKTFKAQETLSVRVEDADINSNAVAINASLVPPSNGRIDIEGVKSDSVVVTLTEQADGVFVGNIKTEYAENVVADDNILQVRGDDKLTITYLDAIDDLGRTRVPIATTLTVRKGQTGILEIKRQRESDKSLELITNFNAGESFIVEVRDADINVNPDAIDYTNVNIKGNLLRDELQLVLQETDKNSNIFRGTVQTALATDLVPPSNGRTEADPSDDILQVTEREIVTIIYIDEVDTFGRNDIQISSELTVRSKGTGSLLIVDSDFRKLSSFNAGQKIFFRLDDVLFSSMLKNTARITVRSSITKDSEEVVLEEMPSPGSKRGQGIYVGSIRTSYGLTSIRDNILQVQGGEEIKAVYIPQFTDPQRKTTEQISDSANVNKGTTGKINIVSINGQKLYNFNIGDKLYFKVEDPDLNISNSNIDKVDIRVSGEAVAGVKTITLTETDANLVPPSNGRTDLVPPSNGRTDSGVFIGNILTCYGRRLIPIDDSSSNNQPPVSIELIGGETVTATYYDDITESGEINVKITDTCRANMIGVATYTSEKVVIDGNMAGWPLENALLAGDEGSNLYVQWDEENLYILAYIIDSNVIVKDPVKYWEGSDALEIFIDTQPVSEFSSDADQMKNIVYYDLWFCPKGAGDDGSQPFVGQSIPKIIWNYSEIEKAIQIISSGYILEARIPFKTVLGGFDPYNTPEEDIMSFNYIIYRDNSPKLQWAPTVKEELNLPLCHFGTLVFRK